MGNLAATDAERQASRRQRLLLEGVVGVTLYVPKVTIDQLDKLKSDKDANREAVVVRLVEAEVKRKRL